MPSLLWQAAAAIGLTLVSIATVDAGHAQHAHEHHGEAQCDKASGECVDLSAVVVEDIEIAEPWLRAMLPGQPAAGGYITIVNRGSAADRLVAVTSPRAGRVEIHEMAIEDDVMKMRPVDGGLALAPGETVELAPGGLHLMFLDVRGSFAAGEQVPVTLEFETAGKADISFEVREMGGAHDAHRHD